jgi:hypothetical protein
MRFEYRNWGGSTYGVIWLYDYNPIARMFLRESIGMVQKQGKEWVVLGEENMKAKTRKELSEMMAKRLIS